MNTLNNEETITYDNPKPASKCPRCPRLVWAGLSIFACNAVVFGTLCLSPELNVGVYGEEHGRVHAADKPSPFTETVDTQRHKVRLAERITPVVVQEASADQYNANYTPAAYTTGGYTNASYDSGSATSLSLPRASQTSIPVRRASETTLNLHRGTESGLTVPRAPETSLPIRRVSETVRSYPQASAAADRTF